MSPDTAEVGTMDGPVVVDTLPVHSLARWRMKNNLKGGARFRRRRPPKRDKL